MKTQTHHNQTFRSVPAHSKPFDTARLEKLFQQQIDLYNWVRIQLSNPLIHIQSQ